MNWKVFLIVFMIPSIVMAQTAPPIQVWPPGEDNIAPLRLGEKAPYDGQLFTPETALRWGNMLQQYQLRLKLDVQLEIDRCKAETAYRDKLLKIEKTRARSVEKDLQSRLLRVEKINAELEEEFRNPPWYNTRTFGVIVGVLATSAIVGMSVLAVNWAK
jgi:hypothetical protein